jgi:hypothetical protein
VPKMSILSVPILKGDDLLGVMTIYHLEVRPFTDMQIALVETLPIKRPLRLITSDYWTNCATVPMNLAARLASCRRLVRCPKR